MEPDDDLWGCLVHPLQLHCISKASLEVINLLHLDIQGELGGKLGVQQQQGILQETWGDSWWEQIMRGPRQGGGDPVTPPTRRQTHQEQCQRDAQWAARYQNKTAPTMLVRRNLASYIHGALLCWAELIPTETQIGAATIQDVRTFLSTTVEMEGFCATAEEVYATRTTEEEMMQELLKDWQKGAHGYIPEVKEDNVIQLGCENVNSLSIFHPIKSKMRKLTNLHQRYQSDEDCIVELGINFKMAATGTCPEDLFPGVCSSRVSAGHIIHELHNRYQ
jgi:hypothetical protein